MLKVAEDAIVLMSTAAVAFFNNPCDFLANTLCEASWPCHFTRHLSATNVGRGNITNFLAGSFQVWVNLSAVHFEALSKKDASANSARKKTTREPTGR